MAQIPTLESLKNANPHQEGEFTKRIEEQTAKLPSVGYLSLAVGSMAISAALAVFTENRKPWANFVGLWAPTILILGLYNKLVKIEGSDMHGKSKAA